MTIKQMVLSIKHSNAPVFIKMLSAAGIFRIIFFFGERGDGREGIQTPQDCVAYRAIYCNGFLVRYCFKFESIPKACLFHVVLIGYAQYCRGPSLCLGGIVTAGYKLIGETDVDIDQGLSSPPCFFHLFIFRSVFIFLVLFKCLGLCYLCRLMQSLL